jgi:ABC-type lipoprotein release transport system permease subunit
MLVIKLAFRNVIGAGLRTWLNVFVLSIAFVAIIWLQGLIDGQRVQIINNMVDVEMGGGQFWHKSYDPFDPLTVEHSHAPLSAPLSDLVSRGQATPILIAPGAIFPDGRVQTTLIKGIDPDQRIINIPAGTLKWTDSLVIPALIGARMARQTGLQIGDFVTLRWRDVHGTFDASDIRIAHVMKTHVPSVDTGQVWIPIGKMREMLQAPGEASLIVLKKHIRSVPTGNDMWIHRDLNFLLKDIMEMAKTKSATTSILYVLLMSMALLAIFDTQVLAIFRRRKEMGTLMALGMPRSSVVCLFTAEGALHGILALLLGAVYGIPLMLLTAAKGLPLPKEAVDSMHVAMPSVLYPSYSLGLVGVTTLLVFVSVTLVSFLPLRRIVKLKPTDALRGRFS